MYTVSQKTIPSKNVVRCRAARYVDALSPDVLPYALRCIALRYRASRYNAAARTVSIEKSVKYYCRPLSEDKQYCGSYARMKVNKRDHSFTNKTTSTCPT